MKRLFKSKTNKCICGVCGGIGEYTDIDPTIMRLVAVLLTIASGFFLGLLLYIIAAIVMPTNES